MMFLMTRMISMKKNDDDDDDYHHVADHCYC